MTEVGEVVANERAWTWASAITLAKWSHCREIRGNGRAVVADTKVK